MKPSQRLFDRRGRELGLAARPRLDLARHEGGQDKKTKTKNHLHRFLYKTDGDELVRASQSCNDAT
jgi:hypothetical protein